MKGENLRYFLEGLLISFTISVIIVSTVMWFSMDNAVVTVTLIWQAFALSVLCSLINLVYRADRISFLWQSLLGYILTTGTIISCGLIFGWYNHGVDIEKSKYIFISFLIYSLFYLFTWLIIWKITKLKKVTMNEKLKEFKINNKD